MSDFAKKLLQAARWMYERKDRPVDWWRWSVLTRHNPDPATLNLDERAAFLIFATLVQDGLLVPVVADDGLEAFTINPGKDAEWRRLMHPWRSWFHRNTQRVLEWIGSGIIGAVIGMGLSSFTDRGQKANVPDKHPAEQHSPAAEPASRPTTM